MPVLLTALTVIGLFVWWNWGRARARSAVSSRLAPLANRVPRRRTCR